MVCSNKYIEKLIIFFVLVESLEDKIKSFTKRKRFKRKSKDTLEFSLIK